jgi:Tol biopolymer transport system component
MELDVAGEGTLLALTAKETFRYYVYAIDLNKEHIQKVARGCSASLSPDGSQVTVNDRSHKTLRLFDRLTGEKYMIIDAPLGTKFDNQFWSNDSDWIVSISEGEASNIYVHQISTNQSWRVTESGGCDRPDLYISRQQTLK